MRSQNTRSPFLPHLFTPSFPFVGLLDQPCTMPLLSYSHTTHRHTTTKTTTGRSSTTTTRLVPPSGMDKKPSPARRSRRRPPPAAPRPAASPPPCPPSRCPRCKEQGIAAGSYFCNVECFQSAWPEHKRRHKTKAPSSAGGVGRASPSAAVPAAAVPAFGPPVSSTFPPWSEAIVEESLRKCSAPVTAAFGPGFMASFGKEKSGLVGGGLQSPPPHGAAPVWSLLL